MVALYATFAGRAFDQLLMDVALHRLPVTLVLDWAGITGPDGPSHHGMWDASVLPVVPGLRLTRSFLIFAALSGCDQPGWCVRP